MYLCMMLVIIFVSSLGITEFTFHLGNIRRNEIFYFLGRHSVVHYIPDVVESSATCSTNHVPIINGVKCQDTVTWQHDCFTRHVQAKG